MDTLAELVGVCQHSGSGGVVWGVSCDEWRCASRVRSEGAVGRSGEEGEVIVVRPVER